MLVLTRTVGKSFELRLGSVVIRVLITSQRGNQIKIGIDAPESVQIVRSELLPSDQQKYLR